MKLNLIIGIVVCVAVGAFGGWHRVPAFGLGWLIGICIFYAAQHCVQWMRRRAASKSDKSMAAHH